MTLNQIKNDDRVDEVIVDSQYEWKYTVYIHCEYLAGDDTSTIVAQTVKEVSEQMADIRHI